MATTKEDNKGFSVLKDHVYSLSVVGKQADGYTKTTKAIAEYMGRVYCHDIKQLVLNGTESVPVEPDYPEGDAPSDRDKAVWSKRYDHFLREETKYNDHKAYGNWAPAVLAEKNQAYKRDAAGVTMAEQNKMLAYMFLDGADKTMFGYLMKNMGNDYALGNDTYPEDVESALQVLLLYQEGVHRKSTKKKNIQRNDGEMVEETKNLQTAGGGSWMG